MARVKRKAGAHDQQSSKASKNCKAAANGSTSIIATRSMKKRSLSDAVFLTTELLENVLRFLPTKDLLFAQRVAKKWQLSITQSSIPQELLFLRPSKAIDLNDGNMKIAAQVNPLLVDSFDLDYLNWQYPNMEDRAHGTILDFTHAAAWSLKPGYWRSMQITQPPATTLSVEIIAGKYQGGGHLGSRQIELHKQQGFTAGDVVDSIEQHADERHDVHWDMTWLEAVARVEASDKELAADIIETERW